MLLDGPVAERRRQGLIGLIAFKRIVRDRDLVDAREFDACNRIPVFRSALADFSHYGVDALLSIQEDLFTPNVRWFAR